MKRKRIEYDSQGSKKIDADRLWGAQTQRSLENFRIGNETMPSELIIALGYQKKAAALTNIKLGKLNKNIVVDIWDPVHIWSPDLTYDIFKFVDNRRPNVGGRALRPCRERSP